MLIVSNETKRENDHTNQMGRSDIRNASLKVFRTQPGQVRARTRGEQRNSSGSDILNYTSGYNF